MLKRELKHLYGAGVLFFYYLKWPIVIGVVILYKYLNYERNVFLDILWLWCVILIFKDFIVMFLRYKRGEKIWR